MTPLGEGLAASLQTLLSWIASHTADVIAAQHRHDALRREPDLSRKRGSALLSCTPTSADASPCRRYGAHARSRSFRSHLCGGHRYQMVNVQPGRQLDRGVVHRRTSASFHPSTRRWG
ncbi:hypothetical protein [Nonomuraea candida]|uniref:hypothetical protein n=1 Tax=Nonomuraea candida TaxID=359159 RepID=UPI0034E06FF2